MFTSKWFIALITLLLTMVWGYAWVLMKVSLEYMGPFTFNTLRFFVGTITLLVILLFIGKLRLQRLRSLRWRPLLILGLLQTALVYALVMYGMRFVDAGKASILLYTMPMWSTVLAFYFLGEKLTRKHVIGLLVGMTGLMFIVGTDIWVSTDRSVVFGMSLILIASLVWSAANIYYQKTFAKDHRVEVNAYQMLAGTIGLCIVTVFLEWGEPIVWTPISMIAILFNGVFASALCFTIWYYLLTVMRTVTATISSLLVPAFGVFFGWMFLDEAITASVIIGAGLILGGIVISQVTIRSKQGTIMNQKAPGHTYDQ
ncbi:DMT family transporter [Desertibacillus haloalkaliphilus]|uniref:DMT family transporter n=1 Tax=Desertibacillus haloalkaliphilus TaxID=1328930 RepID=UPI001C257BAC|nr:DMT family transporter [Desertibacillus haloalkaliphilus]MBU8907989.1 DMT family transporter [Desertibacillus haloalkaliphilus]